MHTVAIIAGGLATRLHPVTEKIPKSLLPVAGDAFLGHQLRLLKEKGVRRVVLCVGHLGERIECYATEHANFGLDIAFSYDGERLLGTGGALKNALNLLGDPFFVLYGDSYLDIDYQKVCTAFASDSRLGLMTVLRNNGRWDKSNVAYAKGRIAKYDKAQHSDMQHIDFGLSILRQQAFAAFAAPDAFDLASLFHWLVAHDQLAGFLVRRRFYEIGSHQGLDETEKYIRKRSK